MSGIRGSSAIGNELLTHNTTKHKEEFDDGVIQWEGSHVVWKNYLQLVYVLDSQGSKFFIGDDYWETVLDKHVIAFDPIPVLVTEINKK